MKNVLITSRIPHRTKLQYREKGLRVAGIPLIAIKTKYDGETKAEINRFALECDRVVFSSRWSVESFFTVMTPETMTIFRQKVQEKKVLLFAIGEKTSEWINHFLNADVLLPEKFHSGSLKALLESNREEYVLHHCFLFPKSSIGSQEIPRWVEENAGSAKVIITYDTIKKSDLYSMARKKQIQKILHALSPDAIGVTSPSNWESLEEILGDYDYPCLYSMGPATTSRIGQSGRVKGKITEPTFSRLEDLLAVILEKGFLCG